MSVKRFQNRIAESRFALPFTAFVTLAVWAGATLTGAMNVVSPQFLFVVVSTYLMVELNNTNALIRIYSRMVSCSFLALCLMASPRFISMQSAIVMLSVVATYLICFHAYQEKRAHGLVFYAFLCLGIGSIAFVQLLYLVPLLWIILATNLMAFSLKNFMASILGLLTPYWFSATYYIYIGSTDQFINHICDIADYSSVFDYVGIDIPHIATFGFIAVMAATGIIHFLHTSYNDKIRTRMVYEVFITMAMASIALMAVFPKHFDEWLAVAIVNVSPLIAHYIALTKTWLTNISFHVIIIATVLLTALNLWMPSFLF